MQIPDDAYWLALTDFLEAANQSYLGQLGVAYVICRRRDERGAGWTIADVVLIPGHFSCFNTSSPVRRRIGSAHEQPDWASCVRAAHAALTRSEPDPTRGANHYLRADTEPKPSWYEASRITATIGSHVFLRLP